MPVTVEKSMFAVPGASAPVSTDFKVHSSRQVICSTGLVVGAAMIGRMTGFGREWMVARLLGSNAMTDAYYAAFTLPNFLSYLIAGGALGMILIPIFTQYMADGKEHESWYVFSTVICVTTLSLFILVLAGELFTYRLAHWIAPGFGADQQTLLVKLIRILLPSQLFLCIGGLIAAVQNAKGRFLTPALAPIVYNVTLVCSAWFLHSRLGIASFAVGVAAGTMLGFCGLPLVTMYGLGVRFTPNLAVGHPGFKKFIKLAIPVMLALSVEVTDIWIVRWFGSYLSPASITWLMYSRYLVVIPVAILGQAAGVASYPFLAQLHASGRKTEFSRSIAAATKGLVIIMVPTSALTMVLSRPLIRFVFSHTQLTQLDVESIAAALAFFALGMSARAAQCIISRGFNASQNTRTPALVGTLITFASLPLYWFCAREWQYQGLAAASSMVAVLFAGITLILLFRRTQERGMQGVVTCLAKVAFASTIGGLLCHACVKWLESQMQSHTFWVSFLILFVITAFGFPLILAISRFLGVKEVDQYWNKLCASIPRFAW